MYIVTFLVNKDVYIKIIEKDGADADRPTIRYGTVD